MNLKKTLPFIGISIGIIAIAILAIWVRSSTINTKTILDYDPFWFYRHAEEIENNNFKIPQWDELSYYPPGRPTSPFQGWSYTMVFLHQLIQIILPNFTLMKTAILSPLIMAALTVIPAFFLGKLFSNNIGGLVAAFFLVLTPTFIGISMAGYCDSDSPVVFHTVLSMLIILIAVKISQKSLIKSIPIIILAIASNLFFIYNWGGGWITLVFFMVLIPGLFIFRIIEEMIHHKKLRVNIESIRIESKPIFISLLSILIPTNIIGFVLWHTTIIHSLLGGLAFTGLAGTFMLMGVIILLGFIGFVIGFVFFKNNWGKIICTFLGLGLGIWFIFFSNVVTEPLLVNISVAELQTVNIFSKDGFTTIAGRVGLLPTIITFIALPILVIFKLYRKEKISFMEIFLFLWTIVSFYLITRGVRFSLLFSISTSVITGYVVGTLYTYLRHRSIIIFSIVFGLIAFLAFLFLSDAIQLGSQSSGMELSTNWYDALDWLKANGDKDTLVATWWDPGHIIAGYSGLKVHADGAHCDANDCIPYNHNIRISDMGKILSTTNETESIKTLEKYVQLTPEQCQAARDKWGTIMPEDACNPIKTVYVIASSDLIQKYYWLAYFGSYDNITKSGEGKSFAQLEYTGMDRSGSPVYGNIITLLEENGTVFSVLNYPQQGIRNAIIKDIVYYSNGQQIRSSYNAANSTAAIYDGLLWVDPSFRVVLFMESSVRDSIFTKMFFWGGEGLEHYKLVYSNSEVKIFKVEI
jgi:dolichyl-phosphooligosaccharide-protein glycotransferase